MSNRLYGLDKEKNEYSVLKYISPCDPKVKSNAVYMIMKTILHYIKLTQQPTQNKFAKGWPTYRGHETQKGQPITEL